MMLPLVRRMIIPSVKPSGSFLARFMISLKCRSSPCEGRYPISSRYATSSNPKVPSARWASTMSLSSMPR